MVKVLFNILSTRQNSILSGAVVLMVTIAASKVLGLVRDRLLAHTFSPDQVAVFLASFRIPDLMFQILIFGAVSVAFIPVFTDHLNKDGEKEAFEFASGILNIVLVAFSLISLVAFFLALPLTRLVVPGFSASQQQVTAYLTQIVLLGELLLTMGSFMAGILQSYQRFIIPALASVFYNLGIIIGIVFLSPRFGIYGPCFGVIIGASLHVVAQLPLVGSLGFRHKLNFNLKNKGIKEVLGLMSMRTIGVTAEQINETVGIILASLVSSSSVTFLTFAQHLQTVPIGLFGATLAQAALPVLSQERSRGEGSEFKATLLTTLHQILFLTLPATAILVVLRIPAVRLVFGDPRYDWVATVLTGKTMAFLALGLSAQSLSLLLVRGFYALKDTKTPVIVSITTVFLNILFSFLAVQTFHLEVWGLGLAYAVSSNISALFLLLLIGKKVGGFTYRELGEPALKMLVSAAVAALALYIPIKALDQLVFDTTRTINLLVLTTIASVFGMIVYLVSVRILGVQELETFGQLIKKIYKMRAPAKTGEVISDTEIV